MLGRATIMMVPSNTTMHRAVAMTHFATPSLRSVTEDAPTVGTTCFASCVDMDVSSRDALRCSAVRFGCPEIQLGIGGSPRVPVGDAPMFRQAREDRLGPFLARVVQ